MKVIKPQTFNSATTLVSTSAVETLSNWAAGTYALNAKVLHPLTVNGITFKYQWTSLVANNTATPGTDDTKWQRGDVGNKDAMFDGQVSIPTEATSPLTVTIRAPLANSVAFAGLVGSQLVVTVKDNGANPAVYTRTINLDGTIVLDWYQYFFEPFVQLGEVVLTDLPPYLLGQITMTLTSGSPVEVGEMVWGTSYVLGDEGIEQGAAVSIIDYSRKDTDTDTGRTTFTRRAFSKRMSGQFLVDNDKINGVQRILADIRAVPSVYIGSEDAQYAPLVVYGFYRDFSIDIAYPTKSLCRIEVEGLI
ncbi:MAG: hypothetical protein EBS54_03410 [Betaproteobacteria bacterium]|nr:hypothetical protein [Betaproteobacteria bacterium]NCA24637.1 hypothetical protein [Betaproteobacteria bacterium]NDC86785.1 hypothetical protein [Betaproteobacteria bacterium]